ncbi:MAG TPA: rhodanese-like domain-containing protein [Solirubrobacteraceae bacterium]
MQIKRTASEGDKQMVPRCRNGCTRVVVDAAWGTIQPIELAPGVRTVGELEVIEHLEAGRPVVDTRRSEYREQARIPASVGIPHEEIGDRIDELDRDEVTVLLCNGPQCAATPDAIRELLDRGYPADRLRYYRGGLHDWMTLGLPIEGSRADDSTSADKSR